MIELKRLKPEEYAQLSMVEEGYVPDPNHSVVLLAKEGDEVIGRTMLMRPWHVEGTWVKSSRRCGLVGALLLGRLQEEAKSLGINRILAYSMKPEVEGYLERLGYKKRQEVTVWTKDI